ncbi:MAG TPA: helix-hairpin-helix domain-containing protein [Paludibacter sp.]|mgnify:CR=1 FL=1|nr:MAG: Helix-hairpin-helix motif protein [Bacteroidetes bacterium ADurb.Bin174]HQB27745.1 helix-hairpin-helix domain-containing protein [Paludibacter sp.]
MRSTILMYEKLFVFCLLMLVHVPDSNAQATDCFDNIDQYIADIFEQYAEESEKEMDFDSFYEELFGLSQQALDLNQAGREDFGKMIFLSDLQIENILYYRYKAGMFLTIYELMLVEGLDMTDIRRMLPFVCLSENGDEKWERINFKEALKYGKNEVLTRFDIIPEQKAGYIKNEQDSPAYLGNPLCHHLKYRFHYRDKLYVNTTAEKDAGEQFWGKHHKGYDFLSGSIQLKDYGCLRNLIVGDYQVSFGQGLVIRQTFNLGKSAMATKICDTDQGFKRYGSTNEYNFMRGLACSWQFGKAHLHLFYSNKLEDGNLQDDRLTGFYTSGYHRTALECMKRDVVHQQAAGGNFTFQGAWFQVGVSSLALSLDKKLDPKPYPYNLYYFRDDRQFAAGIHYRFRWHQFNIFGEAAGVSDFKYPAVLTGVTCAPVSRVNFALLYRYFPPEYNAFYSSTFAASSGAGNEQGFYFGMEVLPFKHWKLAFYADAYKFPWLRYGIDFPSKGNDYFLQLNYTPQQHLSILMRLKHKQTQVNPSGSKAVIPILAEQQKSALRLQFVYEAGSVKFKNQVDGNLNKKELNTYGLAMLQEISVKLKKTPLHFDLSFLFFDAKNYENLLYMYERDVLYAFSTPSFSGVGCKYYVNLRYDFTPKLSCWLKIAQTHYADDREKIGSSHEAIMGDRKTEIKCLVRLKF